jgi:hypothetical protein
LVPTTKAGASNWFQYGWRNQSGNGGGPYRNESNRAKAAREGLQISKSGSGRRKAAGVDGLLISGFAVQFDKVDQQQPVRWTAAIFGLAKQGNLVGQRWPRSKLGLSIPQRKAIYLGLCQIVLQPLLVA